MIEFKIAVPVTLRRWTSITKAYTCYVGICKQLAAHVINLCVTNTVCGNGNIDDGSFVKTKRCISEKIHLAYNNKHPDDEHMCNRKLQNDQYSSQRNSANHLRSYFTL